MPTDATNPTRATLYITQYITPQFLSIAAGIPVPADAPIFDRTITINNTPTSSPAGFPITDVLRALINNPDAVWAYTTICSILCNTIRHYYLQFNQPWDCNPSQPPSSTNRPVLDLSEAPQLFSSMLITYGTAITTEALNAEQTKVTSLLPDNVIQTYQANQNLYRALTTAKQHALAATTIADAQKATAEVTAAFIAATPNAPTTPVDLAGAKKAYDQSHMPKAPADYQIASVGGLSVNGQFIIQCPAGYWVITTPGSQPTCTNDPTAATIFTIRDASTPATAGAINYIDVKLTAGTIAAPTGWLTFDDTTGVRLVAQDPDTKLRITSDGTIGTTNGSLITENFTPSKNRASALFVQLLFKPTVTTSYTNYSLRDLIGTVGAGEMGINLATIPNLIFGTLTRTLTMDGINTLNGTLLVLGTAAQVVGTIAANGFSMRGTLPTPNLGPLLITGSGPNNWPIITLDANKNLQQFLLSGGVNLLGFGSGIDLILGSDGVTFTAQLPIFGGLKGTYTGSSMGTGKNTDFALSIALENKFSDISNQVSQYIIDNANTGKQGIQSAIDAVEKAKGALKILDDHISELRRLIGSNDDLNNPFNFQLFSNYHDKQLITYNKDPRYLYAWFWDDIASTATDVYNTTASAVTDAYNTTAAFVTKTADQIAAEATKLAHQTDLGLSIASRYTANGVLIAAEEALKLAYQGLDASAQAACWVVKNSVQYNINGANVTIDSLRNFASGTLPIINFDITFNGKPINIHFEFDLKDIPGLIEKLGLNILSKIKDQVSF